MTAKRPAAPKRPANGPIVVGRRYNRVTKLGDRFSALEVLDADSHHLLRPAKLKAWALQVLTEHGFTLDGLRLDHALQNEGALLRERVATTVLKPLEFAVDEAGFARVVAGGGYEHDDPPMLAARIYELAREVELAKTDPRPGAREFYASQAHATGYELGRLSMLLRVYSDLSESARRAAHQNRDRGRIETDEGKVTKKALVEAAVKDAGDGATNDEAWANLIGNLFRLGLSPVEDGAKDERTVHCQPLDDGRPLSFTFAEFKATASRARKGLGMSAASRGRPTRKKLHQRR